MTQFETIQKTEHNYGNNNFVEAGSRARREATSLRERR